MTCEGNEHSVAVLLNPEGVPATCITSPITTGISREAVGGFQ